jgi:hypothetical protein
MDIIVPHAIRRKELGGQISDEARKLFAKLKEKPELAIGISSPGLPPRSSLHKVYATTGGGARRLLFFCRHPGIPHLPQPAAAPPPSSNLNERWVLLFYRNKSDSVGRNMSPKNSDFTSQLSKNLTLALDDISNSTPTAPRFDVV